MSLKSFLAKMYTRTLLNNFSGLRGITRGYLVLRDWIKVRSVVETQYMDSQLFVPLMANQGLSVYLGSDMGEEKFLKQIIDSLDKDDTFVDIGASFGLSSCVIADKTKSKVIAYEPNPINQSILCLNKSMYGKNIEVRNKAVGSHSKSLEMNFDYGRSHLVQQESQGNTFNTKIVKLDSEIQNAQAVKIDVEGFELNVLKGMTDIIQESQPNLFIELHENKFLERYNTSQEEVISWLKNQGYDVNGEPTGERKHIICKPKSNLLFL